MELGIIQKAWVQSLREHPERQTSDVLGYGTPDKYSACCLGEALCVMARLEKKDLPFFDKMLVDQFVGETHEGVNCNVNDLHAVGELEFSYNKLGLFDSVGSFKILNGESIRNFSITRNMNDDDEEPIFEDFISLAGMNDGGWTWTEIADFIEGNPEKVFAVSV